MIRELEQNATRYTHQRERALLLQHSSVPALAVKTCMVGGTALSYHAPFAEQQYLVVCFRSLRGETSISPRLRRYIVISIEQPLSNTSEPTHAPIYKCRDSWQHKQQKSAHRYQSVCRVTTVGSALHRSRCFRYLFSSTLLVQKMAEG